MSDELLVTLSMRFPMLDRVALAAHLGPVVEAVIAAGGNSTSLMILPWDDEDEDAEP